MLKLKNLYSKISYVLVMVLILSLLPQQSVQANTNIIPPTTKEESKKVQNKKGIILHEVEEKRESNVKHFYKDDNSYEAVVYPYPVHYLKDNEWIEIDNTLEEKDEDNNQVLSNKSNDVKIKIAKKADANKLVKVSIDDYQISWNIDGVDKVRSQVVNNDDFSEKNLSENEKKRQVKNINSSVEFTNVFPQVDLQYQLNSNKLKENFIIKEYIDHPEFSINITTKKLKAELKEGNSIVFYDEDNRDEEIFSIPAPYMYDSKGIVSKDIEVTLSEQKKGYKLVITPSPDWLEDEEREYPVLEDEAYEGMFIDLIEDIGNLANDYRYQAYPPIMDQLDKLQTPIESLANALEDANTMQRRREISDRREILTQQAFELPNPRSYNVQ